VNVLFIASEVTPWAKTGGLADVAGALPKQLRRHGHDVRVFLPFYARVRPQAHDFQEVFPEHIVHLGAHTYRFALLRAPGEHTYFVHCPALYGRQAIYTADPDEHLRFLLLSRAALESSTRLGFSPDIVHCNDWQTGLVPLMLKTRFAGEPTFAQAKTLLTIHNLNYQGIFRSDILPDTELTAYLPLFHQDQLKQERLNFLLHGILYADGVSTVSPTYAREIQTPEHGAGLDELLRARSTRLVGILNGVDYDEWSPQTDRYIPFRYGPGDLAPKEKNKEVLLARMGLPYRREVPTIGIVSRLASQKGFDLLPEALPPILSHVDLRLTVLGNGEPRLEQFFAHLQRSHPGKVCFFNGYNNELAHLIEAGADLFLMPSRYEPCGLNQMYSLKYGTAPIVRKTGGLADTVELWNPHSGEGTGFPFEHYDAEGVRWAIGYALETLRDRRAFVRLQQNAMAKDFSWDRQARLYEELYARLTKL
jgi:starch synthase